MAESNQRHTKILDVIPLIIGIAIVLCSVVWLAKTSLFIRHASVAVGRIERVEKSVTPKGSGHYPVFTFVDSSFAQYTKRSSYPCSATTFQAHQPIEVLYYPADPDRSRINNFGQLWTTPLSCLVFGIIWMTGLGAVIYFDRKRLRGIRGSESGPRE